MRNNIVNTLMIILAMALPFMLVSNTSGGDMDSGRHSDGYGSYDMMGQDPDAVLSYGRYMMRYGFHEKGMPGGSNKYPGYNRDLDKETISESKGGSDGRQRKERQGQAGRTEKKSSYGEREAQA